MTTESIQPGCDPEIGGTIHDPFRGVATRVLSCPWGVLREGTDSPDPGLETKKPPAPHIQVPTVRHATGVSQQLHRNSPLGPLTKPKN